jgi:nucleotide-binding universal stress UspA family protein
VKILVPLDKSPLDSAVLPYVSKLGKRLRATLAILHVVTPMRALLPGHVRQAQSYVQLVADDLRQNGLAADPYYAQGDSAPMILQVADEVEADMIVMATHGRRGMGKLMLGSVAEVVVSVAPVPVLLIRVPVEENHNGRNHSTRHTKTA